MSQSERAASEFFRDPGDGDPYAGYLYYRARSGRQYLFWIVADYDDLVWRPGSGMAIHPFQLNYEDAPIPTAAVPFEPDPAVRAVVESEIEATEGAPC